MERPSFTNDQEGAGKDWEAWASRKCSLLLWGVNMASYVHEEYLFCGCALAMLMFKSVSDGKYVKKSLHLRFGEL